MGDWWNPLSWDLAGVSNTVGQGLINLTPLPVLYAAGGAVNQLTGGHTETYDIYAAAAGAGGRNRFSNATQALSGYDTGHAYGVPGTGRWGLPILNPAGGRVANDVVKAATGLDIPVLLLAAGAVGLAVISRRE